MSTETLATALLVYDIKKSFIFTYKETQMKLVLSLIAALGMVSAFAADTVKPVAAPAAVVAAPAKAEAAPAAKKAKAVKPVKSADVKVAAPAAPVATPAK